ncbi:hypothetical protein ACWS81_12340 (plasmid) [Psychrobacter celer]
MVIIAIGGYVLNARSVSVFYIALACMYAVIALVLIITHSYSNPLTAYSVVQTQSGSV